jgi:hypothetical protein
MHVTIPARAFFSFAFPCRFREEALKIDGALNGWDERFRVPDLMGMEGGRPFADVYMAWNRDGLYFAVRVEGKERFHADPHKPSAGDCLHVWIDTRDVRDARRASRYCHHFSFLLEGGGPKGTRPVVVQERIALAREHAAMADLKCIRTASRIERARRRYAMEIALPAAALTGYDPGVCSRIGFTYLLHDAALGTQSWSAGPDLPVAYDPSLWGTAELVE